MSKRADLTPALGLPTESGPCYVVQRIEEEVRSPRERGDLQDQVEKGKALSNPDANKVYSLLRERGPGGMISQLEITPHAQYRMDLRGVTVPELRLALKGFLKKYNDWKSQQAWELRQVEDAIRRGHPIEYEDSKLKLFIAFTMPQRGVARIVTVYWKGVKDPSAPGVCVIPHAHKHGGYRAPVEDWTPQSYRKEPGQTPDNQEKQQVLPEKWVQPNVVPQQSFNGPGPSGTGDQGKSVHKDKARTQGQPGGDHPAPPARTSPVRRPEVTGDDMMDDWDASDEQMANWFDRLTLVHEGSVKGKPYPGADRQREQKGPAKTYSKIRYRRKRVNYKRRMKLWYRKHKRNPRYKKDQWRRNEFPKRFERRPGGGYRRNEDRAKDWRKDQKNKPQKKAGVNIPVFNIESEEWALFVGLTDDAMVILQWDDASTVIDIDQFFEEYVVAEEDFDDLFAEFDDYFEYEEGEDMPLDIDEAISQMERVAFEFKLKYRPQKRQKKQKGRQKWLAKMQHMKNRAKSKRRSRVRYKRLKRLPAFKKQQQIRRQHPERFRRRMASVLTAPEIAFVIGESLDLGYVRSISPMTGLVTFYRASQRDGEMLWDTMESLPVEDFMDSVGFLSEYDEDAMFKLIDVELGMEAWSDELSADGLRGSAALMGVDCDSSEFLSMCEKLTGKTQIDDMDPSEVALVNHNLLYDFVYDGDPGSAGDFPDRDLAKEPDPIDSMLIDPTDGDWFFGQVNLPESARRVAQKWAEMLHQVDGPKVDPDQYYGRADKRKREPEKKPLPLNFPPQVLENPGSAKVIPWNNDDLVNNRAADLDFKKLAPAKQKALFKLVETPEFIRYQRGYTSGNKIVDWLRKNGWPAMTERGLENLLHGLVHMKFAGRTAANLHDIMERTGEDIIDRSRGLSAKLMRVDPKNAVWLFNVPGSKGDYRVRVKANRKGNLRDMHKVDVKVSCSCPFWQWQGPEHHAKVGDYLYGKPVGTASRPDVKDPSGKHGACKHVIAVLNLISTNNWRAPRSKQAAAQYLFDTFPSEEAVSIPDSQVRALAARYLGLKGGE
jgi:hypothetical protein